MKISLPLLLAFCSLAATAQKSKEHSDLKEYGLTGRVKTMTVYKYTAGSIDQKDSIWQPKDRGNYEYKRTYYFNSSGNQDSVVTFYRYYNNVTQEIVPIYNYTLWHYDAAGNKTGYRFLDAERKPEEEAELKWEDAFHYTQTNYHRNAAGQKEKTDEILYTLTPAFRESSYEVKKFKPWNGVLSRHYIVVNTLDDKGHLLKKRTTDKLDPGWDEVFYTYQQLDRNNNPAEAVRMSYNHSVNAFEVTEYTYYQ